MQTNVVAGAAARMRRLVDDHLAAARARLSLPTTPESQLQLTFARGDRVRDLVTGQEGTIIRGERRAELTAAARPFDV